MRARWADLIRITVQILLPAGLSLLAGCSKDSDFMMAAKCLKAGTVLEDSVLSDAAALHLSRLPGAAEIVERSRGGINEELNNQLGHNDLQKYFRTVTEWRDSSYCQAVLKDYRAEAEAAAAPLIAAAQPDANGEVSCEALETRMAAARNPITTLYAKEIRLAAAQTVEGAAMSALKPYQFKVVQEQLSSTSAADVLMAVREECKRQPSSLNAALTRVPSIRTLTSPTTQQLLNMRSQAAEQRDCGAYPELLCLATLRREAIEAAIVAAQRCDQADPGAEDCSVDPETAVQLYLRNFQMRELEKQERIMIAALEGDGYYPRGMISREAEANASHACLSEALQRGLRGDAYDAFKKTECAARVQRAREEPLRERLKLINDLQRGLRGAAESQIPGA